MVTLEMQKRALCTIIIQISSVFFQTKICLLEALQFSETNQTKLLYLGWFAHALIELVFLPKIAWEDK